jgi:hypothetical protein
MESTLRPDILRNISSYEFVRSVGLVLSGKLVRRVLQRHEEVQTLARALDIGTVTTQNVEDFVRNEVGLIQRGVPLESDLAIAALAVALESSPSVFARRFITDLASLNIMEMRVSISVARECLRAMERYAATFAKDFRGTDLPPADLQIETIVLGEHHERPRGTTVRKIWVEDHASP